MKQLFAPIMCVCFFATAAQAQKTKGSHSINGLFGLAYASDIALESEMGRGFTGVGYQYTTKKNWYIGTDAQYTRNTVNAPLYNNHNMQGGDMYTCVTPSGMGFFVVQPGMAQSVNVVTSDKVFKTPAEKQPAMIDPLEISRLNVMLNAGKRWQKGRNTLEAGLTFMGAFYNQEIVKTNTQQQAIECRTISTGQTFRTMFDVTTVAVETKRSFWAGGGFHARYQYNISKHFSAGMQLLTSMSTEGIFVQAAPRVIMNF
jgi:hypothetical protein